MLKWLKSIDLKNRRTQYVFGGVLLAIVVVGIFAVKMGVFQPKEIAIGKEAQSERQRIWYQGSLKSDSVPQITGDTTITHIFVVKNGKSSDYSVLTSVKDIAGKSDSEIIKMAKQYPLNNQKSTLKREKSYLTVDEKKLKKLTEKYGSFKQAEDRYNGHLDREIQKVEQKIKESDDENTRSDDEYYLSQLNLDKENLYSKDAIYGPTTAHSEYETNHDKIDDDITSFYRTSKDIKSAKRSVKQTERAITKLEKKGDKVIPSELNITAISNGNALSGESINDTTYDALLNNSVNSDNYGGYKVADSSDVLFTKINNGQKVVFDKN